MAKLLGWRKPSCILQMAAVDDIGERTDALPCVVLQPHRAHHFAIDGGDLFALAQIGDRCRAALLRHAERDAAAGTATIEPEHETRLFRRAAVHEGIDAERAMLADQARPNPLDVLEARPPYQRAIAEHPEVALGKLGFGEGNGHHSLPAVSDFGDR